jgi:hypothetical protein
MDAAPPFPMARRQTEGRIMRVLCALSLLVLAVTGPAFAALPETGQTTCSDTSGAPIACAGTGQDGESRAGISWPSPRFTDNGNGTVTDSLTGLIWLKNGDCFSVRTWAQALADANGLASGACGLTDSSVAGDWRLPNVNELESLVNAEQAHTATWLNSQGFVNAQASDNLTLTFNYYWTSTTFANNVNRAWVVLLDFGQVGRQGKAVLNNVWPVRTGLAGVIQLPKTGQTIAQAAGDDGTLQTGASWPVPRFTNSGDGTVRDNLTGLLWTRDANTPGPAACTPGVARQWQEALDFIKCLNANAYLGHQEWRLPNRKELRSLIDYSAFAPPLPAGHPFLDVQSGFYWTSTSAAYTPSSAWGGDLVNGNLDLDVKDLVSYTVWPVLGGATAVPTLGHRALLALVVSIGLASVYFLQKQRRPAS